MLNYFKKDKYGTSDFEFDLIQIIRKLLVLSFWIRHPIIRLNAKKYIPDGIYCYGSPKEIIKDNKGSMIGYSTTSSCPFQSYYHWQLCLYNGEDCLGDSCKTCGIKED